MNHRSTIITIGKRRPVMTPSRRRALVRLYWNHRQLVKRYRADQLTEDDRPEDDRRIGFDAGHLSAVTLLLRDRLGIAHNITYINQH
ncbi:hypothetical protein HCY48_03555 [Limosilactobacillus fermentum]